MDMRNLQFTAELTLVLFVFLLTGCSTSKALARQKLDRLQAEKAQIQAVKSYLAPAPELTGPGSVNLFLSVDALNTVLAGLDGAEMPIPGISNAVLHLKTVRTDFSYGYPSLTVDALAVKEDAGITLQAVVVAELESRVDPRSPDELKMRVRLVSLVPQARWGVFDFKLRGFVRDLTQVKIQDKFDSLAEFKLPLSQGFRLPLPARSIPMALPGMMGNLNIPDLTRQARVSVDQVLVLPDGLHVHGQVAM
jgi:hypothetical protein